MVAVRAGRHRYRRPGSLRALVPTVGLLMFRHQ
jgi:hypothetical protein